MEEIFACHFSSFLSVTFLDRTGFTEIARNNSALSNRKKITLRINPREIIFKNLKQLAAFCEKQLDSKQNPSSNSITKKLLSRFRASVTK